MNWQNSFQSIFHKKYKLQIVQRESAKSSAVVFISYYSCKIETYLLKINILAITQAIKIFLRLPKTRRFLVVYCNYKFSNI